MEIIQKYKIYVTNTQPSMNTNITKKKIICMS